MNSLLSLVAQALIELAPRNRRLLVRDIASRAGLRPQLVCRLLQQLQQETPIVVEDECREVVIEDILSAATVLVDKGLVAPEKAAKSLDWRLFEHYAGDALATAGYIVVKHVYKPPPRGFEIDVLAIDSTGSHGIVVDCKHWEPKYTSPSRLRQVARQHLERTARLARFWRLARNRPAIKPRKLLPVVLVLRTNTPTIVEGVVIVPIAKLRGFIEAVPVLVEDPLVRVVET